MLNVTSLRLATIQGKFGYARMYTTKSSRSLKTFYSDCHYLLDHDPDELINIQTDNGSEFEAEFEQALKELKIKHWFSRVSTPKDNADGRNVSIKLGSMNGCTTDIFSRVTEFNHQLTEWLSNTISFDLIRPLDYLTPIAYIEKQLQQLTNLLPMYPARTLLHKAFALSTMPE